MDQRTSTAFTVSLAIHGAALLWLASAPGLRFPRASPSEYRLKIAGHEDKIVFYKFRRELPNVTPPKAKAEREPLRAEVKAPQSIVSSPKNAPKTERMIWTPAPELAPAPVELPNVLAIKLPDPPPRKAFVEPVARAQPVASAPKLAPEAPALDAAANVRTTLLPSKLPAKAYVPPAQMRPTIAKAVMVTEAPQLAEVVGPARAGLPAFPSKLPPRPFTAPPSASTSATSGKGKDIDAPPALDAVANSRDLNIAIVGLNPNDKSAALPAYSSPGQFSAGPVVRPKGADSEGGGTGLSVPDLFVRGPRDKKVDLLAQAHMAPTSAENLRAIMSKGEPMAAPRVMAAPDSAHPNGGATKVSGAPDPRFNGREVFMMAIQMPNITSYSGSWLMWYSDRTLHEAGLAPIAPPVAHRKVDPKYIATAVEERVEGRVTLACVVDKQGHVTGVELVRGIDDRLNKSAEEALAKWEFYPATRKGEPVEVDVLVEIPFHLEPKIERR